MNITIENAELIEPSMSSLLSATLLRASQYNSAQWVKLFIVSRVPGDAPPYRNPGWLEFGMQVKFADTERPLYIGCIERRPGERPEFHS